MNPLSSISISALLIKTVELALFVDTVEHFDRLSLFRIASKNNAVVSRKSITPSPQQGMEHSLVTLLMLKSP